MLYFFSFAAYAGSEYSEVGRDRTVWHTGSSLAAAKTYRPFFHEIVTICTILFRDTLSHPMPQHSDWSIITVYYLTPSSVTVFTCLASVYHTHVHADQS